MVDGTTDLRQAVTHIPYPVKASKDVPSLCIKAGEYICKICLNRIKMVNGLYDHMSIAEQEGGRDA